MSDAIAAYGVTLTRDGNTIAEITKIGGVKVKRNMKNVTSHQSANNYMEFVPTLIDGGSVPIEGNFKAGDTNGQVALLTDLNDGTAQSFVMTFPTAITATWTFTAYVEEFETGEMDVDGTVPFTTLLKVTGKPTLAITASNNASNIVITTATLYPTFAAATYEYVAVSAGDTCTFTVTFAAGTCKLYKAGVEVETLTTTVASSAQSLGADGAMTEFEVRITETGKTTKIYYISVANTA